MLKWSLPVLSVFLIFPHAAYGYLDAGSGSYILQVALALMLGAGFALKSYWRKLIDKIAGAFGKKKQKDGAAGTNS